MDTDSIRDDLTKGIHIPELQDQLCFHEASMERIYM